MIDDGWVIPKPASEDAPVRRMGLTNLSAMCARAAESEWAEIIESHFGAIEQTLRTHELIEGTPPLSDVQELLGVRLFPRAAFESEEAHDPLKIFVGREDLEGTLTLLVYYADTWVTPVSREAANNWGLNDEAALEIGFTNMRGRHPITLKHAKPKNAPDFFMLESDTMVFSSVALQLDRLDGMLGEHGSIIAIPLRDTLLVQPIDGVPSSASIKQMASTADKLYREFEGPISPAVYWTDGSRYVLLGTDQTRRQLCDAGVAAEVLAILA